MTRTREASATKGFWSSEVALANRRFSSFAYWCFRGSGPIRVICIRLTTVYVYKLLIFSPISIGVARTRIYGITLHFGVKSSLPQKGVMFVIVKSYYCFLKGNVSCSVAFVLYFRCFPLKKNPLARCSPWHVSVNSFNRIK